MIRIIAIIILFILLAACAPKQNNFIQNPNGSSELALLMNQMYSDLFAIKPRVIKGKNIHFNAKYPTLLTATPTKESMKNGTYDAYANALLYNVNELRISNSTNQLEAYTAVVQTCIACHNNSCPGPLMRIENLVIKQ